MKINHDDEYEVYKRMILKIYEDIDNNEDLDLTIETIVSEFMKLQYLKEGVFRHFIEYVYVTIKSELEDDEWLNIYTCLQ